MKIFHHEQRSNVRLETILYDLSNKTIDVVHLQHQQLTVNELKRLLFTMQTSGQKIKTVDLSNCGIDNNGAELIATFLRNNTSVTALALNGNKISTPGFAVIADALVDPELFKKQRQLYGVIHPVASTLLLAHDDDKTPETLEVKIDGKNTTLETLSMMNNDIDDAALTKIHCLTLGNSTLRTLDLHGNSLKDDTKDHILATQAYNHSIKIKFESIPVKRPRSP